MKFISKCNGINSLLDREHKKEAKGHKQRTKNRKHKKYKK